MYVNVSRLNTNHVKKAAVFPRDGNFPHYLCEELETSITQSGGQVLDNMQLKTVLVKPTKEAEDIQVSKIIWEDTKTGKIRIYF